MGFKAVNIGVLTINDFNFHPNRRLKETAKKLGHNITLINPYDIIAQLHSGKFEYSITKSIKHTKRNQTTNNIDVIMPRQGAPMGDYGLVLLRHLKLMDIPLINGLNSITITRNQYITLQVLASSGLPVPHTCFITKKANFLKAAKQVCPGSVFPVILKQVSGMGGDGVIKANNEKNAMSFLEAYLKNRSGVIIQQFIPPKKRKDIRIFVIGAQIAGAMELEPQGSEFRANIHQLGEAKEFKLSENLKQLALKASKACDLEIAGIDIIIEKNGHPLIIEVNSSPGFRGLEAATRVDIADQIINYIALTYG
jgi:ribosomal protein S6--L-glutamate ligase